MNLDLYLFNLLNHFAGKNVFLDNTAVFFADYFQYVVTAFFIFIALKNFRKNLEMIIVAFSAIFLSRIVITEAMRHFFFRLRPFVENQAVVLINQSPKEASLPSGHAALFFALATAVYFYNKKAGIWFLVGSFLIGLARIYVGVHWPSDVLAGAVIGIFSGWLVPKFFHKYFKKFSDKILFILQTKKEP
jgi:undecaprenyl-diphosphatase